MFYFFTDPHFLKTILARQTSGTFGFNPSGKADALAKPKKSLFANTQRMIITEITRLNLNFNRTKFEIE